MARISKTKKSTASGKTASAQPRVRKGPRYKSLRLSKRIKHPAKRLPNSLWIFLRSLKTLKRYPRFFLGVILIYGLLSLVLVRGFGSELNLVDLKEGVSELFDGRYASLSTGVALFSFLLSSAGGGGNEMAAAYQTILVLIISLVIIWGLRQLQAGIKISVKEAFYKGVYPLVPFVLVLVVLSLQLTPLIIGNAIFTVVTGTGLAVTGLEKVLWGIVFFLFALLTFYMLASSVFALYIVTLPDMTPMAALRSARQLVLHRRWAVMRKVVVLPLILLVFSALVFVPLIIFATPLVEGTFFIFTMAGLALLHSYMYNLYRLLL